MHDVARVDGVQRLGDLRGQAQGRQRGHALLDARGEGAAGQVLHGDVRVVAGEAVVVDARHVLVLERRDQAVFALETLQEGAAAAQARAEDLEHQLLAVARPFGEVDLRHAAFADHAQRAVARNRHRRAGDRRADPVQLERNRARERRMHAGDLLAPYAVLEDRVVQRARQRARRKPGFAHEIRGACLQRLERDVGIAMVGDQDDRRRVRMCADPRQPGEAVAACRTRVEQHCGVVPARHSARRIALLPRVPFVDARLGPALAQHLHERPPEVVRLVDDEEAHLGGALEGSSHSAGAGQIDKAFQNVDHARHAEKITMKLFGGGKPDHPLADPKEAKRLLEALPAGRRCQGASRS